MARFSSGDITYIPPTRLSRSNVITQDCTWTVPEGATCATFEVWGAGGSGGAKCCCDCYHQGAGGSAGGWSVITIPVTANTTYSIVVGINSDRTNYGACNPTCLGAAGRCTCITGPNITCLNAGCGMPGNNDCYQYCNCAACCYGCAASRTNGATTAAAAGAWSSATDAGSVHNFVATGAVSPSSCRRAGGYIGTGTDSQAWGQGYPTTAGGPAFRPGMFAQANNCRVYYLNCTIAQGWFAHGGVGSLSETCCNCGYARSGENGAVIIRY